MNKLKKWARIKVPASTSNLGPGYDVLGIALKLYNEVEVTIKTQDTRHKTQDLNVRIEISGEGQDTLPKDERNIVWQSMKKVFSLARFHPKGHRSLRSSATALRECLSADEAGFTSCLSTFNFQLKLMNRIPLARGLGSSAAARLGGILAANALCDNFLTQQQVLNLATQMEGHPDNVVPSLVGGLSASVFFDGQVQFVRLNLPSDLCAVVCIPNFELSTAKARSILPQKIARQDAVFNLSRISLLLGALTNHNHSFLKIGMEDRLHQDYRKKLIPGFDHVMKNGYRAGALGISLSGSGPSIFALASPSKAKHVGEEMRKGFLKAGHEAQSLVLKFDLKGSRIECGLDKR